ncbi:MAG: TonB-dependent receptor [Nevskia sp.]|nr:TonB-dependent receptor [Nevskia sp.]
MSRGSVNRAGAGMLLGCWVLLPAPVVAQSIDYGALERLFAEPVTTSVTGSPQRASEVPANLEIITADEIRRSGAKDIPGVLSHVSGIDVLQWTNAESDVSVRGYDEVYSPRLLVLVDGRQVYADYYGFTPWNTLPVPLRSIRQIEVVKGPNAALFGFNAVGGVINIITYNPLYDTVDTVTATGGTQNLAQGSAIWTGRLGDAAAVRLSTDGMISSDFSTAVPPAEGPGRKGNDNRRAADLNAVVRLGAGSSLRFDASHADSADNELILGDIFQEVEYHNDSLLAQLSSETSLGLVQATAYTNWIKANANPGYAGQALDVHNRVSVVQLQDLLTLGPNHTLRGSLEYRYDTVSSTPFTGAEVYYDIVSAGGMWNWKITPAVALTNALRVDRLSLGRDGPTPAGYPLVNSDWNRSLTEPSFNSGLVWKAGDEDTLRLILSRGVQLPSLLEDGGILFSGPLLYFAGIPTLHAAVVNNGELGWDHEFAASNVRLRASIFHQHTDEVTALGGGAIAGSMPPYISPANIGSSTATGLELALTGSFLDHWRWGLSYRPEFVIDHFLPFATNGQDFVDYQHGTPRHQVKANLGWARGRWEADGYLRYQSGIYGMLTTGITSVPTRVDGYVALDGRLGYKAANWLTLSLSGQNLGQARQRQTSGPDVERRILGTVTIDY